MAILVASDYENFGDIKYETTFISFEFGFWGLKVVPKNRPGPDK